jgi:hypothetical protein
MVIAGIPERSRNTWREPKYRKEVGIHGWSRSTDKKKEYME